VPRIGPLEIVIILVIILVIFGVGRLPEVGGGIGKGLREFRSQLKGDSSEDSDDESTDNKA
jgi:sec-independent protein translocase protein TatA